MHSDEIKRVAVFFFAKDFLSVFAPTQENRMKYGSVSKFQLTVGWKRTKNRLDNGKLVQILQYLLFQSNELLYWLEIISKFCSETNFKGNYKTLDCHLKQLEEKILNVGNDINRSILLAPLVHHVKVFECLCRMREKKMHFPRLKRSKKCTITIKKIYIRTKWWLHITQ